MVISALTRSLKSWVVKDSVNCSVDCSIERFLTFSVVICCEGPCFLLFAFEFVVLNTYWEFEQNWLNIWILSLSWIAIERLRTSNENWTKRLNEEKNSRRDVRLPKFVDCRILSAATESWVLELQLFYAAWGDQFHARWKCFVILPVLCNRWHQSFQRLNFGCCNLSVTMLLLRRCRGSVVAISKRLLQQLVSSSLNLRRSDMMLSPDETLTIVGYFLFQYILSFIHSNEK